MTLFRRAACSIACVSVLAGWGTARAAGPAVEPPSEPAVAHDAHEESAREAMGDDAEPPDAEPSDPDAPTTTEPDAPSDATKPTTTRTDATPDSDPDASPRESKPARTEPSPATIEDPAREAAAKRWPMGAMPRRRPAWMSARVYTYLTRPLDPSARHLDHGVLQVAVAGGTPHLYRVELALGLLDHLSLGVTAHWLPGDDRPRVSPRIGVAFYRWHWIEIGALHFWSMFPPPDIDVDPTTPSFRRSAQWILATGTFSQRFLSAGIDAGAVRSREIDDSVMLTSDLDNASTVRWHFGGGLHLRAGTRRWGFTAQAHMPQLTAEIVFDLRFGLFELRPRGGWRPNEVVRATDRRFPQRR